MSVGVRRRLWESGSVAIAFFGLAAVLMAVFAWEIRALPGMPKTIVLRVRTSTLVIPETGENATSYQPNIVDWQVDASGPVFA